MFFLKELPSREMVEGLTSKFSNVNVDETLGMLTKLREASVKIRELEAFFSAHGLSQLRFLMMLVIEREIDRDSLTASEIADRLDVSKPVITRTLQSLNEDALVIISSDENDRRTKMVSLSAEGREKLLSVLPDYFRLLSKKVDI